jgi:hypothetical protein
MRDLDIYNDLSFGYELKKIGVDRLRAHIKAGTWEKNSPQKHGEAIEVVRRFDASKAEEASAMRDVREEETLSIAKEANRIASEALVIAKSSLDSASEQARWAKWAAIIAMTAAIIAAKEQI